KKQIKEELKKFIGVILQTPPLISAVHFQGKRLYELAREGKKVNPPERKVEIKEIKIIKINIPKILIKVICKEGVYIRSLAVDLGEKLTSGAHLSSLIRLKSGPFKIKDALSLEKLEKKVKENKLKIISPLRLLKFPLIILKDEELKKIKLGQKIFKEEKFNKNQMLSLVNQKKEINAIGKYLDGFIQPIKVLV
ncbi:MAG: tRNA pseudouridine(55) synthase TruB, partial [Armatimonadetes bacterium]|nr:tRNA pseudouridine(55) synthase TruB [Armatimonadota bacterium]